MTLFSLNQSFRQLCHTSDFVAVFQVLKNTTAYIYPDFVLCYQTELTFTFRVKGSVSVLDICSHAFYNEPYRCSSPANTMRNESPISKNMKKIFWLYLQLFL